MLQVSSSEDKIQAIQIIKKIQYSAVFRNLLIFQQVAGYVRFIQILKFSS